MAGVLVARESNISTFGLFITYRIASKDLVVEYCPTEKIIFNFFVKLFQGSLFHKFRDAILNLEN